MPKPTDFPETNALCFVQMDDPAAARAEVATLLPGELKELRTACLVLAELCSERLGEPTGSERVLRRLAGEAWGAPR